MRRLRGGRPHSQWRGAGQYRPFPGRHPRALWRGGSRGGQPGARGEAHGRGTRGPAPGRRRHEGVGCRRGHRRPRSHRRSAGGGPDRQGHRLESRSALPPREPPARTSGGGVAGGPGGALPHGDTGRLGRSHLTHPGGRHPHVYASRSDPRRRRRARPSTRGHGFWGSATPAERNSTSWPSPGILGPSTSPSASGARRVPTSRSPA